MKIETKLNIATALAVIVFGFALCASAVTADWDAVKRLVGDAASSGSNNVSVAAGAAVAEANAHADAAIVAATGAVRKVDGAARVLPKYLWCRDFFDSYADDAAWYYERADMGGACSSVRDGDTYARNFDFPYDHRAEFVVRMAAGPDRFASVGVSQVGTNLTEDIVTSGEPSRYFKALPGATVDGVNENGVAANINVVAANGNEQTVWPGHEINAVGGVRWVLDHATSAGMAASNLAAKVYIPASLISKGYSAHFMIADETETWIVEDGVAHRANGRAVLTNFRLYADDDPYGTGYERYDLLASGGNITSAWFRAAYRRPFSRPTEFAAQGVGTHGETAALLAWASANIPQGAPESLKRNGRSWQSLHTSIYDLPNRILRIAVQENDDWYVFGIPGSAKAETDPVYSADRPRLCTIGAARQMVGDAVSCSVKSNANGGVALFGSNWQYIGSMAFSHGNSTMASNKGSHAEGYGTGTAGMYAHAEGSSTHANGVYSHSEGDGTLAQGDASHAEGIDSSAYGVGSHAAGYHAYAGDDANPHHTAFAWQGYKTGNTDWSVPNYVSHGVGTYNINPWDPVADTWGIGGFWIGETNFPTHVANLTAGKVNRSEIPGMLADAKPSDYETVKSNASTGSSHAARTDNPHGVTAAQIGAASADDLEPLASDISRAYQYSRTISLYMTGNTNAWFAGTNYVIGADAAARRHFAWEAGMDAATVPCSMALWENRDGAKQCVWDQRDWPTWYWSFKAAQMRSEFNASNAVLRADVNAAINSDEAHAWAKRYASTGRVNPDPSTTFIDTPSVCLSPGMSWETVATVGGCGYWTIVGNGAVIGGSGTNAVLDIKDFEGNSILQIAKGEHRLAWLSSADFVSQMTDSDGWVCFDMRADVQPTGYFSTTLVSADFVAGSDANCPAQFTWENRGGGVWRVHFLLKPGIVSDACFAKFQVEVEGKTQIRYNADTVINGGLIYNGVKIAPVIPSGAAVGSTVTWKVVQ